MSFARSLWKLLVGIKDLLVLIFMLLFFGMLFAILRGTPDPVVGSGVLVLDLDGIVVEEAAPGDPLAALTGTPVMGQWQLGDLLAALESAETDDRVEAVALDLDGFLGGGQAAMTELGDAIADVRAAGKTVSAYATGYTGDGYQLAAHADEIHLNPLGLVAFAGPGGSNLYYAEFFDRIGVTANIYRAGEFKSATEPYTRSGMSDEARENARALVDGLFDQWQDDVRAARPAADIDSVLFEPEATFTGADDLSQLALDLDLVDAVSTRDEWHARLAELGGEDKGAEGGFDRIEIENYIGDIDPREQGGDIGIVTIAGTIVDGEGPLGSAAGESIAKAIEKTIEDRELDALVLRIDSPGGSVLASERIRLAVEKAKAKDIPVVASFGNVAASGGYWVATPADAIFAQPSTLTGSIGVFAILPSFEGTMDKLGIGTDGVTTTPLSGEPDILGGISPAADAVLQAGVDDTYRRFLALVAESRNMDVARARELAEGRVYVGGTAQQLGLVDRFGSLDDAIAHAAELADIEGEPSLHYIQRDEPFPGLLGLLNAQHQEVQAIDPFERLTGNPEARLLQAIADVEGLLQGPRMQARCLECAGATPRPVEAAPKGWLARLLGV
ncbi:signal peptide peptidase SppA [Sphingomicrobium sediminis]|uniref:Signal peptide peptidase SppA n=1 Tax=Sphingomicrobium sediminis TaxID=2950949 RepID=A0A9X2EH91_9SPHN|nr:signal peptide peptidase SppA [Sphingomicrobium sediminis]MCM8557525.1 signal peptide peptidase SppA [Sphingomicrobium sediminis]